MGIYKFLVDLAYSAVQWVLGRALEDGGTTCQGRRIQERVPYTMLDVLGLVLSTFVANVVVQNPSISREVLYYDQNTTQVT